MNLKKHTINLREGDYDYLATICQSRALPVSNLIRSIISAYVDNLKQQEGRISFEDLGNV